MRIKHMSSVEDDDALVMHPMCVWCYKDSGKIDSGFYVHTKGAWFQHLTCWLRSLLPWTR